jgi:hypothetical protein
VTAETPGQADSFDSPDGRTYSGPVDVPEPGQAPGREALFPCCRHCDDGDGMLPCGEFHDEACGTGDCGLVTDAELAEWRKGLQL